MKKLFLLLLILPFALHAAVKKNLSFEENRGQVNMPQGKADADPKFVLRGKSLQYYFSDRGYSVVQRGENGLLCRTDFFFADGIRIQPEGERMLPQKSRYIKSGTVCEARQFEKIVYRNINGNDLEFSVSGSDIRRTLIVRNAAAVQNGFHLEQNGALTISSLSDGQTGYVFETAAGRFSEYAESGRNQISVTVPQTNFSRSSHYTVTYQFAERNGTDQLQSNTTISWLTYLGGTSADELFGIALLPENGSVVAGRSNSTDFPATANAMQDTLGGNYDVTINRFDSAGTCLWSTYYGGTNFESAYGVLVVDSLLIIYGSTNSIDLPLLNAYQPNNAGSYDAFAIMLNDSGILIRGTYFGGTGADQSFSMAVDTSGNLVMAGSTTSQNLPLAASGYQPLPAGAIDAFIASFDMQLQPIWSTCYGGTGSEDIHSVTVTPQGEIVFCGGTYSSSFPVTPNAYQSSLLSMPDVYIVKFGMDGTRHYATFFGGSNSEDANAVVCDSLGNFYITGFTFSNDFPITGNVFQSIHDAQSDAYLAKFNSAGQLSWSSFIGGNGPESAIALYRYGKYLFAAGNTESSDFPVQPVSLQPNYAGNSDGFFVKMDTAGNMVTATYSGGSGVDAIYGLTITPDDTSVIACADTYSSDLPASPGAFQQSYTGSGDGYVLKFGMSEELSTLQIQPQPQNSSILLYPNPASEWLTVLTENETVSRIEMYDASGRLLLAEATNTVRPQLNIAALEKGIYSLRVYSRDNSVSVIRFVKI